MVAGVSIPKLSSLTLWTSMANRDPAQFPDPNAFDIRRTQKLNLAFSMGTHQCLGINLARAELQAVLTACVDQLPGLRLAVPASEVDVRGIFVRSPLHIPLAL